MAERDGDEDGEDRAPRAVRQSDSGRTLLVVDDVPYLLDLASVFLARTARVVTALGGRQGLESAWRERPDLILCDLHMPGLGGVELCRAIRRDPDLASTPIIMLVSGNLASDHGLAIRAGANDVLAKPLERTSLCDTVSRFLSSPGVRGLPRVETAVKATLTLSSSDAGPAPEVDATVRNLSRGGAFVETAEPLARSDEVGLRFRLPGSECILASNAEVVWSRRGSSSTVQDLEAEMPAVAKGNVGVGLRFLEIDGASVRTLDDYVFERAEPLSGFA